MLFRSPLSAETMAAALKKAGAGMAYEGIADQRLLPVVSEQLAALQNGQLLFRGDLFPGQHLDWSIAEREGDRNQSGERVRSWETSVSLTLPVLGPVSARLTLDGARIAVKLDAETAATVAVLESGRVRLAEQLEGAGLIPAEMSVAHVT